MKRSFLAPLFLLLLITAASTSSHAQCYGSLMMLGGSSELDRTVRLSVHFGDVSSIPYDIVCGRSLLPGETTVDVPIYAYNLHEGIAYAEFSIACNESLDTFVPDVCFNVVASERSRLGLDYRLDLAVQACQPACGPVRIGSARIVRTSGHDPLWIDLCPNGQTGKMYVLDTYGQQHNAYSPQHGGYVGQGYLYACQEPMCEEPNAPVVNFTAEKVTGCVVRLTWVGGGGDRTMIRFRTDQYPTGYQDGELAADVPSLPGQSQAFVHNDPPTPAMIYYKAFSLTRDAYGTITKSSFVECSSIDAVWVECEIGFDPTTWGAIKSLFR
jgi:hypothetical protein